MVEKSYSRKEKLILLSVIRTLTDDEREELVALLLEDAS